MLWLREQEPDAYARVRQVLLLKDCVRLQLTGERATDASDASGTLLLDLRAPRMVGRDSHGPRDPAAVVARGL